MKYLLYPTLLLSISFAHAATPVDGLYSTAFGGYSEMPNNLHKNVDGVVLSHANYTNGYNAGGSLGYQSNPMRYEAEVTYLQDKLQRFNINNIKQTTPNGYNQAVLGMANVYYNLPVWIEPLQPDIGIGIGYAWVSSSFSSTGPNVGTLHYKASNNVFAYQARAGLTYNFAEDYALGIGYRYIITNKVHSLGKSFQANLALGSITYRFDGIYYQ